MSTDSVLKQKECVVPSFQGHISVTLQHEFPSPLHYAAVLHAIWRFLFQNFLIRIYWLENWPIWGNWFRLALLSTFNPVPSSLPISAKSIWYRFFFNKIAPLIIKLWIFNLTANHAKQLIIVIFFLFAYLSSTKKQILSLYFWWNIYFCLGVAFYEVCGPSVFHIKVGASH